MHLVCVQLKEWDFEKIFNKRVGDFQQLLCKKHFCNVHACHNNVCQDHDFQDHVCHDHACHDHVCHNHVCQDHVKTRSGQDYVCQEHDKKFSNWFQDLKQMMQFDTF